MKKLCVLSAIVLALAGLLFTACPDVNGDVGGKIDTTALEAVIGDAWDAKFGIQEADEASEVPVGESWVPKEIMKALDDAIVEAQTLVDNPTTQAAVSAAKAKLEAALAAFNAAIEQGTGAAITLSGTITAKNKGQIVPYVVITAHTGDWSWQKEIRVPSPTENSPWSMTISPFSEETEIFFRVRGHNNSTYGGDPIFNVTISDLSLSVYDEDIDEIDIDLSNLSVITLSGTINISYNGQPVPSVVLQFATKDDWAFVGEVSITNAGNNTPWSLPIPAFNTDTEIIVSVVGFATTMSWVGDYLFEYWGLPNFELTVKDQNKSGIAINFVTLSGTLNINGRGPVPSVVLDALYLISEDNGNFYYGSVGETTVTQARNNTPWSMMFPALNADTEIIIVASGYDTEIPGEWDDALFRIWPVPDLNLTIKDQSKSGIAINLAFVTLSGTINATINGAPVPRVSISAYDANAGDWLGGTSLESPAPNAPWSMMLQSDPTGRDIYIYVDCNSAEDEWLGSDSILLENIANLSNIALNVALNNFTLSGTLNVTINGAQVPSASVSIHAYDITTNDWLGSTMLEYSSTNAAWSMVTQSDPTGHSIRFDVTCYSSEGEWLGAGEILKENVADIANIALNFAMINFTLSGTLNVTVNGAPVPLVSIQAWDETTGEAIGNTWLEYPSANATWSMVTQSDPTGHDIRFDVTYSSSEWLGSGEILKENVADIANISLNLGEVGQ
jgi:hypothetical protein